MKTYTWKEINSSLMKTYGAAKIVKVLVNLPRGRENYTWPEINESLMKSNFSTPSIARVLVGLNRR